MERDDQQVGRILSRRQALALVGAAGASLLTEPAVAALLRDVVRFPSCVVRPEQTEGPYFVDERLNRSDIRSDPADGSVREGVPLELTFRVSRIGNRSCEPLAGAVVDVWQCDALGVYSDVRDMNQRFDTVGKKFLRGHQVTDANGVARFLTIYPGWYEGRAVHIHFKIRGDPASARGYEFTSQLYFDDATSDRVFRQEPYARKGQRSVRNQQDRIFRRGGDQLLLPVTQSGRRYAGTFEIGLQIG